VVTPQRHCGISDRVALDGWHERRPQHVRRRSTRTTTTTIVDAITGTGIKGFYRTTATNSRQPAANTTSTSTAECPPTPEPATDTGPPGQVPGVTATPPIKNGNIHTTSTPPLEPTPVSQQQGSTNPFFTEYTVPKVAITTGDAEAAEQQLTVLSPPGDMEISPEEVARLFGDADANPADDVDMEVKYFNPPTSP